MAATGYWELSLYSEHRLFYGHLSAMEVMRATVASATAMLILFATFSLHGTLPSDRCFD
jgi:hypothetical protein